MLITRLFSLVVFRNNSSFQNRSNCSTSSICIYISTQNVHIRTNKCVYCFFLILLQSNRLSHLHIFTSTFVYLILLRVTHCQAFCYTALKLTVQELAHLGSFNMINNAWQIFFCIRCQHFFIYCTFCTVECLSA